MHVIMAVINITALTADGNELISLIGHPHRPPGAGRGVRAAGALGALQPPRRAAGCSRTQHTLGCSTPARDRFSFQLHGYRHKVTPLVWFAQELLPDLGTNLLPAQPRRSALPRQGLAPGPSTMPHTRTVALTLTQGRGIFPL